MLGARLRLLALDGATDISPGRFLLLLREKLDDALDSEEVT